jgi:hypothetical protein
MTDGVRTHARSRGLEAKELEAFQKELSANAEALNMPPLSERARTEVRPGLFRGAGLR